MMRPVVMAASQATRASGSLERIASRIESETWSASLSGCPSAHDSDVKRRGAAPSLRFITLQLPPCFPRRQNRATVRAPLQAPGVPSLGREFQVVNAGVAEKPGAALGQEVGHRPAGAPPAPARAG